MRTYDEIKADIETARIREEGTILKKLAEEVSELNTPESRVLSETTHGLADMFSGSYDEALQHFQMALSLYEAEGDQVGIASVIGNMGTVYRRMSDFSNATESYRRSISMYEDLGDQGGVARMTGNLGTMLVLAGDHAGAIEHFNRALAVHEELGQTTNISIVTSNLGVLHSMKGEYEKALEHYDRAWQLERDANNRAGMADIANNIGNVHIYTGDYPRAVEMYHRAIHLYQEVGDLGGVAQSSGNLGGVYISTGDYPEALERYESALDLYEDRGDTWHVAAVCCNLGTLYGDIGERTKAVEFLQRALGLQEELGDLAGAARSISNLGHQHNVTGEYEKAIKCYERSRQIRVDLGDMPGVSKVDASLVSVLIAKGDLEQASLLADTVTLQDLSGPSSKVSFLTSLATLQQHAEHLGEARSMLLDALQIALNAGIRSASAELHERLRDLAQDLNDFEGYVRHNKEFLRIKEEVHGSDATQKLAMIEVERRINAERRQQDKEKALLYGALPPPIADRILNGEVVRGDQYDNAAVLFMDIAGSTRHSASLEAHQVVELLSQMFTAFDEVVARHGLMKIKTIGDAYLAVAFPPTPADSPERLPQATAASAALELLRQEFTWPDGAEVEFRIGLHCGPIVAGVIGTQQMQYDVWGDTVNVATLMESTGEPGRIQVSSPFATALGNGESGMGNAAETRVIPSASEEPQSPIPIPYSLRERGAIEVKGKGTMTTYWLESA